MDPTFQFRQVRKRPEGVFGKTAFVINITITMNNLYQTGQARARPWRCRTEGTWRPPCWTCSAASGPPAPTLALASSRRWARGQPSSGSALFLVLKFLSNWKTPFNQLSLQPDCNFQWYYLIAVISIAFYILSKLEFISIAFNYFPVPAVESRFH